jgi:GDPmannose 4,6-dehydratase
LIGDATKAREKLKWNPKHDLPSLVKDMISSDVELFKRDKFLLKGGHKVFNYHE